MTILNKCSKFHKDLINILGDTYMGHSTTTYQNDPEKCPLLIK